MLNSQLVDPVEVISLGRDYGADKFVKKFALDFEMHYSEVLPYHEKWNPHCVDKPFMFGKNFSPRHYFSAYKRFVTYCDKIVIFDTPEDGDSVVNEIKKIIKKQNKNYVILQS
jgi:hypothetical protein